MTEKHELPTTVTLSLDEIHPYPNNPRVVSDVAIRTVADSIRRFGYVQPIVVDTDHVIIVGHTRYAALAMLGHESAEVYVSSISQEKAAEYRLVDNRAGELSQWDDKALILELREWEPELVDDYFPDVNLEIGELKEVLVTDDDVARGERDAFEVNKQKLVPVVGVKCPACAGTFQVKAQSLPGVSDQDLDELSLAQG